MSFAGRLKEARESKQLTQKQLADLVGVRNTAISNYEKSISFPNVDILYKIFNVLQIEPNYFFQDDITTDKALANSHNIYHIPSPSEIDPDLFILDMYKQLDIEDRAEIRGTMKQMLKADKYSTSNASYARIAAKGQGTQRKLITDEQRKAAFKALYNTDNNSNEIE